MVQNSNGKMYMTKKIEKEIPLSIDVRSNENEKHSMKEHNDKFLAVNFKVI